MELRLRGKNDSITPKKLQKALNEVRGEPYEAVVSTMMLRSMKQAKYDITPTGHYGLAAEDYTHFTSPIRRYPDLIVHRMIRHYGKRPGHLSKKEETLLEDKLQQIADQSSRMERLAVQAERDVNALKKAEYMQDKVGGIRWYRKLSDKIRDVCRVSQYRRRINSYFSLEARLL